MKTATKSDSWTRDEIRDTVQILASLANPVRMAAFALAADGHETVESIRAAVEERIGESVSQPTASRAVNWLAMAGLLYGSRQGKGVAYSPTPKGVRLLAMLARLRAEGGQ